MAYVVRLVFADTLPKTPRQGITLNNHHLT